LGKKYMTVHNLTPTGDDFHFRRALDHLLEGCQIIGYDWRYLYVNETAARHGQRAKHELIGCTMMECYPGIDQTAMFALLQRCMQERTFERMENEFVYADGTRAWFELTIQPIPEGIFILSLDVTERKQAENALKRYAMQMEILHEIDIGIINARSIPDVIETALKNLRKLIACQRVSVVLFDWDTNEAILFADDGSQSYVIGREIRIPLVRDWDESVLVSPTRIFSDLRSIEPLSVAYEKLIRDGLLSGMKAFFVDHGQVIGFLGFNALGVDFFKPEDQEIATQVASQLTIAIRQMNLSKTLVEHTHKLEAAQKFLKSTLDAFPANTAVLAPDGTIISVNGPWIAFANQNDAHAHSHYLGSNYLQICDEATGAKSDEAPAVAAGIRAVISGRQQDYTLEYPCDSPMETVWYMLRVTPFDEPAPRRVVVAHIDITNRKEAEKAEREQRLVAEALRESVAVLAASMDVESMMQRLLDYSAKVIPSEGGTIILFDQDQPRVAHSRGHSLAAQAVFQTDSIALNSNNFTKAAGKQSHYLVADTKTQTDWITMPHTEWIRSSLGVPIVLHDKTIGLLVADSAIPNRFTQEDVANLEAFAQYAALALENAYHVDQLEARVDERTAELQSAKERAEAILNSSADGIFLTNRYFAIQQTNAAFNRLFACRIDAYFEQPISALVPEDARELFMERVQEAILNGQPFPIEVRACRHDQTLFDAELSIGSVKDKGLVCTVRDITERKAQERLLRYHASLQAAVSDSVIVTDMTFRIRSWNQAAERIYGWTAEEVVDVETVAILGTEYLSSGSYDESLMQLRERGWWQGEVLQRSRDGSPRYILASVTIVKDSDGTPLGIVSVNHDISERKKAEEALKQKSLEIEDLYNKAPCGYHSIDKDGLLVRINDTELGWLGYSREEVVGKLRITDLFTPESVALFGQNFPMFLERGFVNDLEFDLIRKDGSTLHVLINAVAIYDDSGSFLKSRSSVFDMTTLQQARHALLEREMQLQQLAKELEQQSAFLRSVIDVSPSMIFIKDFNGRFVLANTMTAKMYNTTVVNLVGKTDAEFNPSIDEVELFLQGDRQVITSGEPLHTEEAVTNFNGEVRWLQTTKVPILGSDRQTTHVLGVSTDITERKQVENAVRQALEREKELGELKTRFVSMASHEFRTPLATILALTETLVAYRHRLTEPEIDLRFTKIKLQIDHLKDIMDDVLLLGRMQARRMEFNPVMSDIDDLCRSVIDEFQSRPELGREIQYRVIGTNRRVMLDKKLIRQITNNLVSNAVKYSPAGSVVFVEIDFTDTQVRLRVKDAGIGIPEADLKHLFEPFHRASNVGAISGTGLGLVITKEAIELHGGTITVDSTLDSGSTFEVVIPLAPEGAAS
jgi:PAS domain S-box-containing protein